MVQILTNSIIPYCQVSNYINNYTMDTTGLPDQYVRMPEAKVLRVNIAGKTRVHIV